MPSDAPGPARPEARTALHPAPDAVPATVVAAVMALPAVRPGVVSRTLLRIAQRHLPPPAPELSASVMAAWWPRDPGGTGRGPDAGGRAGPGGPPRPDPARPARP
jgi:hypothetical protein